MTKSTPELIEDILGEYKEYMSWILLVFVIISALLQLFLNWLLASKIEKYKNDLTKGEIKFTRHTEMQIECLKKMYDILVTFHFSFSNLIKPPYLTHETLQNNIKSFQVNFLHTVNFCHRNKILLTDEIVKKIGIVHEKFNKIDVLCRLETDELSAIEDYFGSLEPQVLYKNPEDEVEYIKLRIIKLNENNDVKSYEADIKELRELIENYFKQLVS